MIAFDVDVLAREYAEDLAQEIARTLDDPMCQRTGCDVVAEWKTEAGEWLCDACGRMEGMR